MLRQLLDWRFGAALSLLLSGLDAPAASPPEQAAAAAGSSDVAAELAPMDSSRAGAAPDVLAGPGPAEIPPVDALVVVQEFGTFRISFYREDAPNHVAQFLTLAASGYFDGMTFHRVIPGFLLQTGDPNSRDENRTNDGRGGPDYRLPPEPSRHTHLRGSVSMAWQGDEPGTAGSQWFVTLADLPQIDGQGTVIGEVVEGMDAVDRIAQVSTYRNRNPVWRVVIQEVRLVESVGTAEGIARQPGSSQLSN